MVELLEPVLVADVFHVELKYSVEVGYKVVYAVVKVILLPHPTFAEASEQFKPH